MVQSLIVYSQLPPGCIAHLVQDEHSLPDLRPGEWAVVDTADKTARNGDVYLVQWQGGRRSICQARHHAPSSKAGALGWSLRVLRPGLVAGETGLPTEYLESKLVGAVIGVFLSKAPEPLRIEGRA